MSILKPDIPGTVIRWRGSTGPRILPSAADTVAIPIVHDWGPVGGDPGGSDGRAGGAQLTESFAEYVALFGDSDTAGRTAVAGAFAGQNLPGEGGAGAVVVYRMAGASAAAASATIDTSGAGATAALTLTAKYKGTRGNSIAYAVDTDPNDSTRDRLRIYFAGALRETYTYAQTDVAGLAAQVNLRSNLVTATDVEAAPTRLAATTAGTTVALAGGDDGSTLTSADHLTALEALEFQAFGVLAPYDVTDSAIIAAYVSWLQAQRDANRPVRLVIGGGASDDLSAAIARSAGIGDEHVVNLGIGQYHDDLLDKDLTTSQLAPRVAGILAAKGEEHSLTYSKIGGLHVVGSTGPASDEVATALQNGVVALMRVSAADADLRIAKGVTTFTNAHDADRPLDVFSDARLVGVMDNYVRNMKAWGDDVVIGALPVNDDTRRLVYGYARQLQDDLLARGLILPGDGVTIPRPFVVVDDPADPNLADAIPYSFGWQFAQTANYILGEGSIR